MSRTIYLRNEPNFERTLATKSAYESTTAVAELIDNSIGAKAHTIKINISGNRFSIADFGEGAGMNEITFEHNFFMNGASSTQNDSEAAGIFGVGGKTGILAIIGNEIATDVEFITHRKGYKPIYAKWEVTRGRCDRCDIDVLTDDSYPLGTSISFAYDTKIDVEKLVTFIGVTYCWNIKNGTKIYVNDELVEACDPLYREHDAVVKGKLFSTKTFKVNGEVVTVNIVGFKNDNIIPREDLHVYDKGAFKKGGLRTTNRSGIYVRTGGRYYTLGGNFTSMTGINANTTYNGMRVEVIVPKSMWEAIGVIWNKSGVTSFTKIEDFVTGDIKTGVLDYIVCKMNKFSTNKHEYHVKAAKALTKNFALIQKQNNIDNITVTAIATNKPGKFIVYDKSKKWLYFDVTNSPTEARKDIYGIVKSVAIVLDTLIKNNCRMDIIKEVIERFNVVPIE